MHGQMPDGEIGAWALLIDGENVSSGHAAEILTRYPRAFATRNVYGDLTRLTGWSLHPELAVIHTPEGRNSADIRLTIDAMVMAQAGTRDFVIVSRDGGLVHLVRHLRGQGCRVVVMADAPCSHRLAAAAHHVVALGPQPVPDCAAPPPPTFDGLVRKTIEGAGKKGLEIKALDSLVQRAGGPKISDQPEGNWRAYLTAQRHHGLFRCDPKGPNARVRLASLQPAHQP
jgi:hypothetical protein